MIIVIVMIMTMKMIMVMIITMVMVIVMIMIIVMIVVTVMVMVMEWWNDQVVITEVDYTEALMYISLLYGTIPLKYGYFILKLNFSTDMKVRFNGVLTRDVSQM